MDLDEQMELTFAKAKCEGSHLYFSRYFFRARQSIKFIVNWHHHLIADVIDDVIQGRKRNVVINVSPGASKTELVVINFIARGLALNPRARFLHLSGSDSLASLNSATARDLILSDEFQALWPLKLAADAKAKKRWNVLVDGQPAGGVYATALGGQVTGFRAGHMTSDFQGAILLDDPIKPEEAFSRSKLDTANRKLLSTVNSRRANPMTPIVLVMQRIAESDPTGFIKSGALGDNWDLVRIPALLDEATRTRLAPKYRDLIDDSKLDKAGRCSYWPYKEPIEALLKMESGQGADTNGQRISRHVYSSQYDQAPVALGGNIIKGIHFVRYKAPPRIKYRLIYGDTAQKTREANDFSNFDEWGMGVDGKIYLLDNLHGKFEAPELQSRTKIFWAKRKAQDVDPFGRLRELRVEDKASGTGLIQSLKLPPHNIPIKGIEREKDKLTRVMDALPYIEAGLVCLPEDAPFTNDCLQEYEAFTADDSHDHDDRVDTMIDAVNEMLSSGNILKQWEELGKRN